MSLLDPGQVRTLEERVRAVEAGTGAQIVVVALARADGYHGLRWRAYAFGTALAGGAVVLAAAVRGAPAGGAALPAVTAVLGAGLALALAATLVPAVERIFLETGRAERELRRRAEELFLERGIFATRDRTGLLLLAGAFERAVAVRPDAGYGGRLDPGEWRRVEDAASRALRAAGVGAALRAGLDETERLLAGRGFAGAADRANELADRPVVEGGAR